jgi:hypothetical protein
MMATWIWVLIIVVAVAVLALAAIVAARQRRSARLRERFGPEYDRAVQASQDRRTAEAELVQRQAQRAQFDIHPLPADSRGRFAEEWRTVQELFVDQPASAVTAADGLVYRVMEARGYPMGNFAAQADLVSVDYPAVVENYRVAHGIHERAQTQQVSTEDLREALLRYRSLFDELLGHDGAGPAAADGTAGGIPAARTAPEAAPTGPAADGTAAGGAAADGAATSPAADGAAPGGAAAGSTGPEGAAAEGDGPAAPVRPGQPAGSGGVS